MSSERWDEATRLGKDLELGPSRQQAENRPGLVCIGYVHGPGDVIIVSCHEGNMRAGEGGEKDKACQQQCTEIKWETGGFHS